MSDRELYQRAKELFARLFDEAPGERAQKLAGFAPDPELRALVEELLAVHDQDRSVLRTGSGPVIVPSEGAAPMPERIGEYRVVRRLGAGAMGVVYEAEQEKPRRRIALKVVRPGVWSDEIARRFEQESALLARLQHPGIAQVYEVGQGQGPDGPQPYFALEFVDGADLRRFVEEQRLDPAARIGLLLQVCAAVQHAHDRGVLHRDLKPDNIAVTAEGHVKVLDFGIARAIDHDTPHHTTLTSEGQVLGTLPYMSPEQISGAPVDARSDLYALGVIAYELLSGSRPLDVDGLPLARAAQIIAEREPPRLGTELPEARGDLETIVATALHKEPERRYASARDLAEDLERFLRHEPIRARPASALYQLRKFAWRHRTPVAALGTAVLAMAIAIPLITISLLESRSAAERSAAVNDWLTSVLATVHPNAAGAETRLLDALDIAAAEVGERFGDDPEQEILVRKLLAEMYHAQSMTQRSLEEVDRALELSASRWDEEDPEQLELEVQRLVYVVRLDQFDDASAEIGPLLDRLCGTFGEDHELVFTVRRIEGSMIQRSGDFEAAAAVLREVFTEATRALGPGHPVRGDCLNTLANALLTWGRQSLEPAVARASLEECVERVTPVLPGDDDAGASLRQTALLRIAADAHAELGHHAEAERLARQVVDRTEGRYGEHHAVRLDAFHLLARVLSRQGRYESASDWALRALDGYLATEGRGSPLSMGVLLQTERLLLRAERFEEAERLAREGLSELPDSMMKGWLEVNHRCTLACCLIAAEEHAEAAPLVDELLALHEAGKLQRVAEPDRAPLLLACLEHLEERGELDRAERAGLAAAEIARVAGLDAPLQADIRRRLAAFYERNGREEDAARWVDPD